MAGNGCALRRFLAVAKTVFKAFVNDRLIYFLRLVCEIDSGRALNFWTCDLASVVE